MKNTISFITKFGWISATEINHKITTIQFNKTKNLGILTKNLTGLKKEISSYFSGKTTKIKIPVKILGNPIQKKIWNQIRKIPRGKTNSYGNIAKAYVTRINTNPNIGTSLESLNSYLNEASSQVNTLSNSYLSPIQSALNVVESDDFDGNYQSAVDVIKFYFDGTGPLAGVKKVTH